MKKLIIKSIHGFGWLSMVKIFTTIIDILTKIVLAWILTPYDFGLIGLGMLVMMITQKLTEAGFSSALIQKKGKLDDSYLNAGWTIQISRGFLLFLIIYFIAPYIPGLFQLTKDQDLVINIIRFLALIQLIDSSANIGLIVFDRELEFRKITVIQLFFTIVKSSISILVGILYKTVWSIVLGYFFASITKVFLSYYFQPFRPRFKLNWNRLITLFSYGIWVFFYTILTFIGIKLCDIVILKVLGVEGLGLYQMAFFISMVFKENISEIVCRIIFPLYTKIDTGINDIKTVFIKTMEISAIIFIPTGIGVALIADLLVSKVLSAEWQSITPIIIILSVTAVFQTLTKIINQLIKALGYPKMIAIHTLFETIIIVFFIIILINSYKSEGVAISLLIAAIVRFGITSHYSLKLTSTTVVEYFISMKPAIIGVISMTIALKFLSIMTIDTGWFSLWLFLPTGILAFMVPVYLLVLKDTNPFLIFKKI
jgi:lipopolysaccharide exporter